MDLSIVIVNFNTEKITSDCIKSLIKHAREITYEIILIDNGSTDNSKDVLSNIKSRNPNIKFISNESNLGFGKANNQGIRISKGKYILLLNSDTIIESSVLSKMVNWMDENADVGIATCALKNTDGSLQGTGGYFPTLLRVFSWMTIQDLPLVDKFIKPFHPMKDKAFGAKDSFYESERDIDWITGAFMMIRRGVIDKIKGFDEDFFMYGEDVDLCFRAKNLGWKVRYLPQWSIIHLGGKSGTKEKTIINEFQGIKTFYKKHYPSWQLNLARIFMKLGAFWRIIVFGILEGKKSAMVYTKAFISI